MQVYYHKVNYRNTIYSKQLVYRKTSFNYIRRLWKCTILWYFKNLCTQKTLSALTGIWFYFLMFCVTTPCFASIILSETIYNLYLRLYKNCTQIIIADAGISLSGKKYRLFSLRGDSKQNSYWIHFEYQR